MRTAVAVLAIILLLALGCAPCWSEGIDLVVMVDTSASMFRVFPDLVEYLLSDLLTEHLRFGDTFHLLAFADSPEIEISGTIDSEKSIEQVLRRFLLLKPLGDYTDLVAALRFLSTYVRGLPEGNRKTILLLTDGIHDPPPDSPFRLDPDEVRRQLFQTAREIARAGWKVHILKLPQNGSGPTMVDAGSAAGGPAAAPGGDASTAAPAGEKGTEEPDYTADIARALRAPVADLEAGNSDLPGAVGFPTIRFPEDPIRGGRRLTAVFTVESAAPEAIYLEMDGIRLEDGSDILQAPASVVVPPGASRELIATIVMPESTPAGRNDMAVDLSFSGGMRVSPSHGTLLIDYTGRPGIGASLFGRARSGGAVILFVLLGAAAVALVVLAGLGLRSRVDLGAFIRNMGYREGRYARESAQGYPLVEMIVTMQNRHIGHRNVHSIRPGGSCSVGGGRSSYLIYFVPVPPTVAYLTYDGRTYTFVPVRPELFPEVRGQIADCLGRDIPAVSARGYRFTIVFRPYHSPLDEINSLLRSIRVEDKE